MRKLWAVPALAITVLVAATTIALSDGPRDCSPQTIMQERVKLFFASAHEPLTRLASEVYLFAADSERCRLNDGAKPCGLPSDPLKSTDLQKIFDYYVKQPVDASLNRQQVKTQKGDWTWRVSASKH